MGFSRQEYWSGLPLPSPHFPYTLRIWPQVHGFLFQHWRFLWTTYQIITASSVSPSVDEKIWLSLKDYSSPKIQLLFQKMKNYDTNSSHHYCCCYFKLSAKDLDKVLTTLLFLLQWPVLSQRKLGSWKLMGSQWNDSKKPAWKEDFHNQLNHKGDCQHIPLTSYCNSF